MALTSFTMHLLNCCSIYERTKTHIFVFYSVPRIPRTFKRMWKFSPCYMEQRRSKSTVYISKFDKIWIAWQKLHQSPYSIKKLKTKSGTKLGWWKRNIKMTLQQHASKTSNTFGSTLNQKQQAKNQSAI